MGAQGGDLIWRWGGRGVFRRIGKQRYNRRGERAFVAVGDLGASRRVDVAEGGQVVHHDGEPRAKRFRRHHAVVVEDGRVDENPRFAVDAEFRFVVDVAEPFDGIGDAEPFRFLAEHPLVGGIAVADGGEARRRQLLAHHLPDVEKIVNSLLRVQPAAEHHVARFRRRGRRELLDVDAAVVGEKAAVSETPRESLKIAFVCNDESGGAALHEDEERALVEPVDDVLERRKAVAAPQVFDDEGNEEEHRRNPAESEFALKLENRQHVAVEVAAVENDVIRTDVERLEELAHA